MERSEALDRVRIREAAARAPVAYPGPVGELLSRELLTWEQFGYRLGSRTSIMQIVDQILNERAGLTECDLNAPAAPQDDAVRHDTHDTPHDTQVHAA